MPIPPPRKKRPRPPSALGDTALSFHLPDMTGAATPAPAAPDPSQDAYRELHARN